MSSRERLESYLNALRRRLRIHIYARAAAVGVAGTLIITTFAVWLFARQDFSPAIVFSGRGALIILLLAVAVLLVWRPLRELRRDDGAQIFEERLPEENGRIQTYLDSKRREAQGISSPLTTLLAADAAEIAERTTPQDIVSGRRIGLSAALAVAALLVLVALVAVGPAYWGFASRHLLFGFELPRDAVPVRRIVVTPGDATVRRNSDIAIQASIEGFRPREAQVWVRFADRPDWERAPMMPRTGDRSTFEFKLYAVRAPLQYYVDAEGTRSAEHRVGVVDLPRIERVRLTYNYPQWTGLSPRSDEEERDIRAVEGTSVDLEVFSDAPLDSPALIIDGTSGELAQDGRASTGKIDVIKPGRYQIGARVAGEFVALSDEYSIEIVPDEKPVIEIRKPGRDWRATSIEEVPVRIQAEDDFRLRDVSLRYSVNGGDWQSVAVGGGAKRTEGESLLDLEQLGASQPQAADSLPRLIPGDLVSYYAVAKDRKSTVQTDLFMVQVQPFERKFRQAQGGGGGGGGMADEQGAISERQREILLATWNLQRNDERNARSRQQLEDNATMLAELQITLAQQARTLATRTRARASVEEDENIKTFVESLEKAASVMDPAADFLSKFRLQDAVPVEQQALQHLLRAEAAFREVQVSMERNASGDGSQQARNFTEMFELEMDLEKNQYESESQVSQRNQQKELDEAIRKLKELAERQERLAQEQNRQNPRLEEQRWKQEQLRREAEDLRRRLAELNRQQQQSDPSGQQSQSDSESQSGQSGQQSSSGSNSSEQRERQQREQRNRNERQREQLARALESVNQALKDMQAANGSQGQGQDPNQENQSAQNAQNASKSLRRALQQIDQQEPSNFDETLEQFADRSEQMLDEQRQIESDLYEALSQGGDSQQRLNSRGGIDPRRAQALVRAKQQMTNDLTELQGDMRNSVHANREDAPDATKRLSEIIRDIEGSDVMYRLNRSAAEIYYGRAREAAPREGLITDALDTLERDLREAAGLARSEKGNKGQGDQRTSEELLAEVGELRRALQEARRGGQGEPQNQQANGQQQQGQQSGENQQGGQNQQNAQNQQNGQGQQNQGSNESAEGGESNVGLAAWNPGARETPYGRFADDARSLARQTAETSQRIRDLAFRMRRGDLSQAELEALRQAANQLRRLGGDPLTGDPEVMMKLIDQIELSALNATKRAEEASARAATPSAESPRYREVVAEYYRRLGNQ